MPAGDLDTSFAGNGKKRIGFGGDDAANAVLVQPNGRIVGPFALPAFGFAAALQANGRILVAGQYTGANNFAIARLRG